MSTPRPHSPPRVTLHLIPWLVEGRDLRRYLGRALDACKKGRVIFLYHIVKRTKRLFSLARLKDHQELLSAARADLTRGRFRNMTLAKFSR